MAMEMTTTRRRRSKRRQGQHAQQGGAMFGSLVKRRRPTSCPGPWTHPLGKNFNPKGQSTECACKTALAMTMLQASGCGKRDGGGTLNVESCGGFLDKRHRPISCRPFMAPGETLEPKSHPWNLPARLTMWQAASGGGNGGGSTMLSRGGRRMGSWTSAAGPCLARDSCQGCQRKTDAEALSTRSARQRTRAMLTRTSNSWRRDT